jgi:2-oxoglutarate dehydrogenase E1 component
VHIVLNNQIGFTTSDPRDSRSTLYCTDVMKMVEAPIFHVNGDDPEAAVMAIEIALDYRTKFKKDVVVDVVCFRKLGHNEQDEPMVTQPLMYKIINQHPGTRKLYADRLASQGVIGAEDGDKMVAAYREALEGGHHTNRTILSNYKPPFAVDWSKYRNTKWNENDDTTLPLADLQMLADKLTTIPSNFKLHPRVEKIIADRRLMGQGKMPVDWGMARTRLCLAAERRVRGPHLGAGQRPGNVLSPPCGAARPEPREMGFRELQPAQSHRSEPGRFRRHRLGAFGGSRARLRIRLLHLGAERAGRMGGAVRRFRQRRPGRDRPVHCRGRGEMGAGLRPGDVAAARLRGPGPRAFLRPHRALSPTLRGSQHPGAYRHARADVFPAAAADDPALPQAARHFYAKSHIDKESVSPLEEFAESKFKPVNADWDQSIKPQEVKRVIVCSGKVFFDLMAGRRDRGSRDAAIIRIAQLYPFPHDEFQEQINLYRNAGEVVWCQEEPGNQGAWHRIQHYLLRHMREDQILAYAMRSSSASPAAGYSSLHNEQQKELIDAAFRPVGGNLVRPIQGTGRK